MASPGHQLPDNQEEVAYWTDETVSGDEEDEDNSDIDDETMSTNEEGISNDGIEDKGNDEDEISGLDPINNNRDRLLLSWNSLSEAERTEHRRLGESLDPEFWEAISKPGGAQARKKGSGSLGHEPRLLVRLAIPQILRPYCRRSKTSWSTKRKGTR